jgi:hypothetical protein
MDGSLSSQLLHSEMDLSCPTCSYPVWTRMSEVTAGVPVICPCCRTRITFVDSDGEMQNLGHTLESKVEQALKEAFK